MIQKQSLQLLCEYGRRLAADRLTTGTGGNLSIFDRKHGLTAITPSGLPYEQLTLGEISVINPDGSLRQGKAPSSEWPMHLAIYRARPDISAIVHTHSPYATTFAVLREEIPACHYLIAVTGSNSVRVAPYATFGTEELARQAAAGLARDNAILLANHGLLAIAPDIHRAYTIALHVEEVAKLYYRARAIGTPQILSQEEMRQAHERFKTYGR
ncbi:MAG: class II aldolase/adducin family protein [Deltaproteobacteria bacterium]|nr:class II aldolase/adducin family protein [Candidatus Anaeroferrophillus wilburensis]MBN2888559.1 class II aldolase/adducin family protein [Deltaproteobacteria bacterium]